MNKQEVLELLYRIFEEAYDNNPTLVLEELMYKVQDMLDEEI